MNKDICTPAHTVEHLTNSMRGLLRQIPKHFLYEPMVVGSLALHAHGFKLAPHDVDLEIESTDEKLKAFFLGMAKATMKARSGYYPSELEDKPRYDFTFRGVEFNVWVIPKFECTNPMYLENIAYASIDHVIEYKKRWNRKKDRLQLLDLALQIVSPCIL